jgi:hypothetical protein
MQKSYAQTRIGTIAGCQQLPITSVTASGNDGNLPANVLDNNLGSRWSNLGGGSFIQADLGVQKSICSVDVAWYRGNLRVNSFVISVSSDGTSFTNVFTGKSSGTTVSAEKYTLPTSVTARFVRITVNGNTENNWASITELSVDGNSSTNTNCTTLPIGTAKASGNDGNLPANVLDSNPNTRWSNLGIGSWIQADLGSKMNICGVNIAWYNGNNRQNNFVISISNDGTTFTNVFTGKSSGTTLSLETYLLPGGTAGKYVRITVNGNTQNNWASITELSVDGTPQNNPPPLPPVADNKTIQTNAGTPVTITLTGTDPIPGDTLKFSVVTIPQHGTLTNPTSNTVTYTPTAGFLGSDSFTYKATTKNGVGGVDSNIATVTITVNALPPPPPSHPTADNKTILTNAGTPVTITLTGTDPISGDVLKFAVVGLSQHGTVTSPAGMPPNTVSYTPNAGFSGTDSFTYKATDGQGVDSALAMVAITVNAPPPTPPTANNINIQTNKETPIGITLTGTDPIQGDLLKFSVVGSPTHGTVAPGTVSNNVFYTPSTGFIGTDSFTYKATDGQGVDSNIATVTVIVSNATSGTLDQFGVREIYPTKASGEQWFMNMNDPNHDSRTDPKTILTKNPDGSWKIASSAVRFQVFTSSGYHPELITTLNQQQMAAKGYMQSPNDWRDVEITGYVKLNKQGGDVRGASGSLLGGHYTWYARGGKHIGQGSPLGCEATSYHADWAYDGKTRFAKEQWHVSYVFTPYKPSTDSIAGKWVGFKTIMYNIQQNGNTAAKIEIWVDANNNGNWVKVNEFVDSGGFGKAGGECGGAPDQIITWGGPIATYRWDNSPDVDVKNLSVREIQAPQ